jgi:hypothetical protein
MYASQAVLWVVYQKTLHPNHQEQTPVYAVCEQAEWDAMELSRPGFHRLVREKIPCESEAEKLARGTSGDPKPRHLTRS